MPLLSAVGLMLANMVQLRPDLHCRYQEFIRRSMRQYANADQDVLGLAGEVGWKARRRLLLESTLVPPSPNCLIVQLPTCLFVKLVVIFHEGIKSVCRDIRACAIT